MPGFASGFALGFASTFALGFASIFALGLAADACVAATWTSTTETDAVARHVVNEPEEFARSAARDFADSAARRHPLVPNAVLLRRLAYSVGCAEAELGKLADELK